MANLKVIKNRISSTKSTRKITRTMEMISTVRSSQMANRLREARPYRNELLLTVVDLAKTLPASELPIYFQECPNPKKVALLVIGADRGLCGGYNVQIHRIARLRVEEYKKKNIECETFIYGKKAQSFFRFLHIPYQENFEIKNHEQMISLSNHLMAGFIKREFERIEIISTVYHSAARHFAKHQILLPFSDHRISADNNQKDNYQKSIYVEGEQNLFLREMMSQSLRATLVNLLTEANTSEHLARRIAMKNGTDAANEILGQLQQDFNRKRQAAITQEISEIVAGSSPA